MNVLNDYTRNDTKLIEGLRLNEDEQLVPIKSNLIQSNNTLTVQLGTPIDLYIVREPIDYPDFNLELVWNEYPIDLSRVLNGTGTYVILICYGMALYSGIMTYYEDEEADLEDEISLHVGGSLYRKDSSDYEGRLYAKIKTFKGETKLFLAASKEERNPKIIVKFRKLI